MKTLDNLLCLLCFLFVLRGSIGTLDALRQAEPYGPRRAAALSGFDLESVALEVDRRLAPASVVSLGRTITSTGDFGATFWYTATYALYPRRVVPWSANTLEVGAAEQG